MVYTAFAGEVGVKVGRAVAVNCVGVAGNIKVGGKRVTVG